MDLSFFQLGYSTSISQEALPGKSLLIISAIGLPGRKTTFLYF
jgi:hypothetical protein